MPAPFLNANPVEIILQNYDQRVNVSLFDATNTPVDATAIKLEVLEGTKQIFTETVVIPGFTGRVVKPAGTTGEYYINWGDPTAAVNIPNQTETNKIRDLFFVWRMVGATGTEPVVMLQVVKVLDPRTLAFLSPFRLQIDKAVKIVDSSQNIFLGYTDAQLVQYLEGGLNLINVYQPNTNMTLENFPSTHLQLLVDVATLVALQSQELFAVDTDIDYSDQGYTFRVGHVQPLAAFMSQLTQRIDRLTPLFKLNFATMGSLHVEAGPSFRMLQLLQASPSGILFRGLLSSV